MEMCFLWLRKPLSGFVTIVTLRPYSVNNKSIEYEILIYRKSQVKSKYNGFTEII